MCNQMCKSSEIYRSPYYFSKVRNLAKLILAEVMQVRRILESEKGCDSLDCTNCLRPHMVQVIQAIMQRKKIKFILPAFPGKSLNSAKVLGHLPDMGEKKALILCNDLCNRIQKIYEPGARLIICSYDRVFSDIVGIPECNITEYQAEIDRFIEESELRALSTFNLDDLVVNEDFVQARKQLVRNYGQDMAALKEQVKNGGKVSATSEEKEVTTMYYGLTRFLAEDLASRGQTRTKSSILKKCKAKVYKAIIRSNAWADLITEKFSEAIQLSIHPQACGAKKIDIQLLGIETWFSPWNAVTVSTGESSVLMKPAEVKKVNSKLILDENDHPCNYELIK